MERLLQLRDEIRFTRDGNGDFYYAVQRDSEIIFSAGAVAGRDGGTLAVRQQHDKYPNAFAEAAKEQLKDNAKSIPIAEKLPIARPYITVRVQNPALEPRFS